MQLFLLPFVVLMLSGFFLALPKSVGCLAYIVRLLAFIVGAVAPIVIFWGTPSNALLYAALLPAVILGASAVTLNGAGWDALLGRRREAPEKSVKKGRHKKQAEELPENVEDRVDLSLFDPFEMLRVSTSSTYGSSNDPFGDCLGTIILGIVGGLFWVGVQISRVIARYGLPDVETPLKRLGRIVLSWLYSGAIYAGVVFIMTAVFGRNPAG
jgi:hypothetical protein